MDYNNNSNTYQNNPYQNNPYQNGPYPGQSGNGRSQGMATAAMVLSLAGIFTFSCGYTGLIFGSLGIILGLLSKGSAATCSNQAKAAVILGIFSIAASIIIIIISVVIVTQQYGGFQNFMEQYQEMYQSILNQYTNGAAAGSI